tara:strand:+ start:468 stop:614 length:147 start_codon:yes stop_codon:yes gene_type:complete
VPKPALSLVAKRELFVTMTGSLQKTEGVLGTSSTQEKTKATEESSANE